MIARANFTEDQRAIFDELNKNKYYDYAIMTNLSMSKTKYYNTKNIVSAKVERIIAELELDAAVTMIQNRYKTDTKTGQS